VILELPLASFRRFVFVSANQEIDVLGGDRGAVQHAGGVADHDGFQPREAKRLGESHQRLL
jgi:hypothetical protein